MFEPLDKDSEKVLKAFLNLKKINKLATAENLDVATKGIYQKDGKLISILVFLLKYQFIFYNQYSSPGFESYLLTHEGESYYERKKKHAFRYWVPIAIADFLSFTAIIISIIALAK